MERLTRDLTIDIISRLPIKSVLRCKSVSKSWEALLSDPFFAAAHFNRASTLAPFSNYIISDSMNRRLYFIETEAEDDETSSTISKNLNFNFLFYCLNRYFCPILMGSCLGYICFSTRDVCSGPTNPMFLFNPITGAIILLPHFKETPLAHCVYGYFNETPSAHCVYGFGLDVSTQECKVVLVHLHEKLCTVQVHTVGRDDSWRTSTVPTLLTDVTEFELAKCYLQTSLPLVFNGSIHWIVSSLVDKQIKFGARRTCILSFQLDTEVFGVIPMPEPLQLIKPYLCNSMMYALQLCGGCLSIIYSPEASFVDMWVMADYKIPESWVKKYSIQLNCMGRSELKPFGFRKNGELMLCSENRELVSYNTDSDRYKALRSCWIEPFPFVGSLISLKSAYEDSEVVRTSRPGNPFQMHQWTSFEEDQSTWWMPV